jgi:predicted transcriptional regulator
MPSEKGRPPLSDAELDVLKVLWDIGPSGARRVREIVNAGDRNWAYTTTKTVLDRLEDKGYVSRSRKAIPHVFSPRVSPDALARRRMEDLRGELFGGAGLPFVRAFLDSVRLTPDEIRHLRASLDELEALADDDD